MDLTELFEKEVGFDYDIVWNVASAKEYYKAYSKWLEDYAEKITIERDELREALKEIADYTGCLTTEDAQDMKQVAELCLTRPYRIGR